MFYDQLKKVCKENNTTVTQLARDLGLTTGVTGHWSRGGTPSVNVLKEIAKRFNVSLDYLLEMDEEG